jgi:hypothetical protein
MQERRFSSLRSFAEATSNAEGEVERALALVIPNWAESPVRNRLLTSPATHVISRKPERSRSSGKARDLADEIVMTSTWNWSRSEKISITATR